MTVNDFTIQEYSSSLLHHSYFQLDLKIFRNLWLEAMPSELKQNKENVGHKR